jgi:phosphoglycolate phosphatase-like HAD superfamily hydrolase
VTNSPGPGVLVLDFDGVICDSWRECALVTWAAHHRWRADEFGDDAFAALPPGFVARFRALRGYARRLGDFLVPVLTTDEHVGSQQDFDRALARLDPAVIAQFVQRATAFRAAARDGHHARWLAFHDLYDGIAELLAGLVDRMYIVTARDSTSVKQLLSAHGIDVPPDRIYGSRESKDAALADIRIRERSWLYFVDDSLPNVVAAQAAGHRAAWALWGYSAAEQHAEATRLGVPALTLHDLPAAASSVTGTG